MVLATGLTNSNQFEFLGQVPATCSSKRFVCMSCSWDKSLRPVPSCKLFRGLLAGTVAGTSPLVCADLYIFYNVESIKLYSRVSLETNNCASSHERHNTFSVTLIVVGIALVYAKHTAFAERFQWTVTLTLQALNPDEEKRKNFDSPNIASCHLFSDILTPLSLLRVHSSLFF